MCSVLYVDMCIYALGLFWGLVSQIEQVCTQAGFFPQEKKGGWHRAFYSSAHDMFFSLCFTSGGFAGTLFNPKLSNAK